MKPLVFVLALGLPVSALADRIIIQNVCGATGFVTVTTHFASCSVGGTNTPHAGSSAQIELSISAAPAEYTVLKANQQASASSAGRDLSSAGAGSTINAQFDLTTTGPVRPGFLQAAWDPNGTGGSTEGVSGSFAVVMPFNDSFVNGGVSCSYFWPLGSCLSQQALLLHDTRIPFTLGKDFEVDYVATVSANAYELNESSSGRIATVYDFRLFEADGFTPVAVLSTAPEPSASALLLVGFVLLFLMSARGTMSRPATKPLSDREP